MQRSIARLATFNSNGAGRVLADGRRKFAKHGKPNEFYGSGLHFMRGDTIQVATMSLSSDFDEATYHVRSLYRRIIRDLPRLLEAYDLPCNEPHKYYNKIKEMFYENGHVRDPNHIDHLRYYGEAELGEALQMQKTKDHIQDYWDDPFEEQIKMKFQDIPEGQSEFLTDFYANK